MKCSRPGQATTHQTGSILVKKIAERRQGRSFNKYYLFLVKDAGATCSTARTALIRPNPSNGLKPKVGGPFWMLAVALPLGLPPKFTVTVPPEANSSASEATPYSGAVKPEYFPATSGNATKLSASPEVKVSELKVSVNFDVAADTGLTITFEVSTPIVVPKRNPSLVVSKTRPAADPSIVTL